MRKQITKNIKNAVVLASALLITACNGFFEKDNTPPPTPLTSNPTEINPVLRWSVKTGSGTEDEYLKLSPSIDDHALYTSSANGYVTAVNKINGHILWQTNTHLSLTTGPAADEGLVVVGSRKGDVLALDENTGHQVWKTNVSGEVLANPAIGDNEVIVKSIDGYVRALSLQDGQERWSFQQVEPNLILRGSSSPLLRDDDVILGFANGNLGKFSARNGNLLWMQPIATPEGAFAIQRMIDIDADPILFEHRIYAATYQGRIAAMDWGGRILWTHDISSYTGMVADENTVYISDAKSHVWAFNVDSGLVNWRQTQLEARNVSGPVTMGDYIVVGDAEGFLHWLSKTDGHFAGRVFAGAAIYAAPIVDNNVLYAFTNNGYLLAYTAAH